MTKHLLVTGGAGFIGANFIKYLLKNTSYLITNIDALTYASNPLTMEQWNKAENFRFLRTDITDRKQVKDVFNTKYDIIIHFAAETHVDRSIQNANPFVHTNIIGTYHLLEAMMEGRAGKMIHISTDEVYGSLKPTEPPFTEKSPLSPNNPYSASKASSDLLVHSYYKTYKLPVIITRCSNNFGPYQHPEKFIPKIIASTLANCPIPIYGDGKQIRDWLFVEDHCRGIHACIEKGNDGEIYNFGGLNEATNLEVAEKILEMMGKDKSLLTFVEDRKGHDRRYSINWQRASRELNWKPIVGFEDGLERTINWYLKNQKWLSYFEQSSGVQ